MNTNLAMIGSVSALAGILLAFSGSTIAVARPPAQKFTQRKAAANEVRFPPMLPGGKSVVSFGGSELLKPPETLRSEAAVAKTPPTIDLAYFPGQTYVGQPWSAWGDSLAVGGKYYASIGDHLAPQGNGFVFEYDPAAKSFRQLVDVRKLLGLPDGHYTPGKIHSRLDLGDDGWLYCSTHRGSTRATTDENHYKGDWIIRVHPNSGAAEVVVCGPVPKHCIPTSVLDPRRLIFYGGTAPGSGGDDEGVHFFAYDVRHRKVLYSGPDGPSRYMILAKSTGRVYFTPAKDGTGPLMRFDPATGEPVRVPGEIGIRAATDETPDGFVYSVSQARRGAEPMLFAFNTKTETIEVLSSASVATQTYVASIDADASGRFLYYVPGAHGGSDADGSAIVQFDLKTRQKKVIAFLHPATLDNFGCTLRGTYSTAVDPAGDKLYITWNTSRGSRAWDCVALSVVHIPPAERTP